MTPFRAGILRAFAEQGLSPEDLERFCEKRSELRSIMNVGWLPAAVQGTGYGLALGLAAPIIAGGAAGYGGAKLYHELVDSDDQPTIDDLKNNELIREMKLQAALMKRKPDVRPAGNPPA